MNALAKRSIAILSLLPCSSAESPGSTTATDSAEKAEAVSNSSNEAAALRMLDSELTRFGRMVERVENARHRAKVEAARLEFHGRCERFVATPFDSVKYDELRFDLNVEIQRLALWLAPPRTPGPKAGSESRK